MERRADLHCHSLYSDGSCRPTELVDAAIEKGFCGLSITDHDSLEAFGAAAEYASAHSIILFPGVEITAEFQEESIHLLGYCFDPTASSLRKICRCHRSWRSERNELMIKKLAELGMSISMDEVLALSPLATTYGRPHIALALMHRGYVKDVATAFRQFLGNGKSCYVKGERSTVSQAIDAIHAAGGLAVLAHPHLIKNSSVVEKVLALPLDGLEAYYAFMGDERNLRWKEVAKRHGLFVTGGSDFHGTIKPEARFGSSWAPESTLDLLIAHRPVPSCPCYTTTVEWLYSKRPLPGRKPDLTRMRAASQALGDPQDGMKIVHVAGTNGKGSVCTKIAKGYELSGVLTGLYTSPHIVSFCERIQVNEKPIPQWAVVEGVEELRQKIPTLEELTFFEITTLLCFWWFHREGVTAAVLETGLGGRFDATNVCSPLLSVITSISFDHTSMLGTTLEAIAAEKAGIIKPGVPVVLGPRVPLEVILKEKDVSEVVRVEGSWDDFDDENSEVAAAAMKRLGLKEEKISKAVLCRPPCRFQEVSRENLLKRWGVAPPAVVLDVAHNPDGIRRLLMRARRSFPSLPICVLFAVSKDKDAGEMVALFLQEGAALICTQSSSPRTMPAAALAALVRSKGGECFESPVPEEAFAVALQTATDRGALLIVTGTFAVLEHIVKALF